MGRIARTSAAAFGCVALAGASGLAPAAQAETLTPTEATELSEDLGARSAGTYLDPATGKMVVTVTDAKAAEEVRDEGGKPRFVARSGAKLEAVVGLLRQRAQIAGTTWGVDPVANKVLLTYDTTLSDPDRAKLRYIVSKLGDAIRIERTEELTRFISGGDAILGGGSRCSLGFNVKKGTVPYFLTAGHCGKSVSTWTTPPATTNAFSFPGDDFALVKYTATGTLQPGNVKLYNGAFQDIATAGNAVVGQAAKKSGSTTGLSSGTVTGLNQTVNYGGGNIVAGLIRTNVCAQPGDSGGALFAGTVALGLVSGGSGTCASGGTVFYQPVTEALTKYGATVY